MPNMNHLRHPLRIKGADRQANSAKDRSIDFSGACRSTTTVAWVLASISSIWRAKQARKKFLTLASETERDGPSHVELGERVLHGKAKIKNLAGADNYELTRIEDYVAQVGQGAIADQISFHLGRNDAVVILFRKIWERELRALSEARLDEAVENPVAGGLQNRCKQNDIRYYDWRCFW